MTTPETQRQAYLMGFKAGAESVSQWISVKDRLPSINYHESGDTAIIYNSVCKYCTHSSPQSESRIGIGWIVDFEDNVPIWCLREPHGDIGIYLDQYEYEGEKYDVDIEVTHWMPIPEPPIIDK
jgi:hypothetical protein